MSLRLAHGIDIAGINKLSCLICLTFEYFFVPRFSLFQALGFAILGWVRYYDFFLQFDETVLLGFHLVWFLPSLPPPVRDFSVTANLSDHRQLPPEH